MLILLHFALQATVTIGMIFVFWESCKDSKAPAIARFLGIFFFAAILLVTWWHP